MSLRKMMLMSSRPINPNYQIVLNYATANSITKPSVRVQQLQSNLWYSIDSVRSKIDVLRIYGCNDLACSAFSLLNQKNPSANIATTVGGITYGYRGWSGNGVDGYINHNFNPVSAALNYTQNSASRLFYVSKASSPAAPILGGQITSSTTIIQNINGSGNRLNSGADAAGAVDLSGVGFRGYVRPNSAGLNLYRDDVRTDKTIASFTIPNENILTFRRASNYGDGEVSFEIAGGAFTEAEITIIRNAVYQYIADLWDTNDVNGTMDLYVIFGQSNSSGRGVNAQIAPELNGTVGAKIYNLLPTPISVIDHTSQWETLQLGVNNTTETLGSLHGIEMRFGYEMYNLNANTHIVKLGVGATSMDVFWKVGGTGNSLLIRSIIQNLMMLDNLNTIRKKIVLRGAIFIQGESDCVSGLGAAYQGHYETLIKDFINQCKFVGIKTHKLRWLDFGVKNGGSAGYDPTDFANVVAAKQYVMANFKTDFPSYQIDGLQYQSPDAIPLGDTQHYNTVGLDTMGVIAKDYFVNYL